MKLPTKSLAIAIAGALLCAAPGAVSGATVSIPFKLSNFSHPLLINDRYLPLVAGRHLVYFETSDGECVVDDFVVTSDTHAFGGPYTGLVGREVTDTAWLDEDCDGGRDLLLEDTFDWYAQDNAGNVWYLGEDTTEFFYDKHGHPKGSSKEGSWESGVGGAQAGLIMLARPMPGNSYQQEYSAGVAEDMAKVEKRNVTVTIAIGSFRNCLLTSEWSPLDPGVVEQKSYCPNLGMVMAQGVQGDSSHSEMVDTGL